MNLNEFLKNRWIEYSGGSRPGTNMLCFSDVAEGKMKLQIKYVFDWESDDVVNMAFDITSDEYENLVSALLQSGYAKLDRVNDHGSLIFKWKLSEGKISFQIDGRSIANLHGPSRYYLPEFVDLLIDRYKLSRYLTL